ncbi:threonine ammonia-lyase [Chloropicon primus]|nr:threonine ammonia-lyase [Chloropicon primus]
MRQGRLQEGLRKPASRGVVGRGRVSRREVSSFSFYSSSSRSTRVRALAEEASKVGGSGSDDEILAKALQRGEPCSFDREDIVHESSSPDLPSWTQNDASYLKQILCARVYDVAEETDLQRADTLSTKLKNTIFLKREDQQQVFSFKLRGAFNKMANLTSEQLERGVICSSAGNHAQGVALSALRLGCKATICMPLITPDIKVDAVKRLGGNVKLVGENYDECQAYAIKTAEEEGLSYIHPFDDPFVIAGQGTVGVEILRQCSIDFVNQDQDLDAIFVPVGGGGLLAGIASFVKQVRPDIKVYGVEPLGAACMTEALMRGGICTLNQVDAFADGVAVKTAGTETFRLISKFCDGIITVTTEEICAAIKDVFKDTRSILEPAGAVSVAGLKSYCRLYGVKDKVFVAVTSGANMNFDRLRLVSDIANFGAKTEVMLATSIPEKPGEFKRFVDVLVGDEKISVTEFKYRYAMNESRMAYILFSVEVDEDTKQKESLLARLSNAGMDTIDLSHIEAAQRHLRHLVGGRARSFTGAIPDERILEVTFPERPGALGKFLSELAPEWNVTLFHYRQTGNLETNLLIGIQIADSQFGSFQEAMEKLDYRAEEIDSTAMDAFGMFLY